ncbi:PR-1-like protein [Pseudovirgaria hyperparasitica]|uniref:PR-1-like protein n=1 Tax=Pseudovirgaria hyperparasitica TaxID=470096 RepID=A0A6A6VZ31_9PEZI|nr:PR-1-like protein [Pseudovirgaria hyperparasitica]KAF2755014.1 PR-1-like protein [Pseudovirgaria hyperparasitica]
MRSSAILIAAFAATALSGPVQLKRALVTEWEYETVVQTVYVDGPAPTPEPEQQAPPKDEHPEDPLQHSYEPSPNNEESSPIQVTPPQPDAEVPKPAPESEPAPAPAPKPDAQAPKPAPESEPSPAPAPEPTHGYQAPAPEPNHGYSAPAPPAPAPTPSAAAPKPSSAPSPPNEGASYQDKVLYQHNVHRANHSATDLVWNQTLADAANAYAQKCIWGHFTEGYGQNLAASAPDANLASQISDGWYNGEFGSYYNNANNAGAEGYEPNMATFHDWGHLSQVVWKETTSVGCTTYDCRGTSLAMWYTICNYYPSGNVDGFYGKNVGSPKGQPTVHGEAKQY